METSGYQPVPNEPGGFAAMPVPVPEPEAPADQGWTYSFVAEPAGTEPPGRRRSGGGSAFAEVPAETFEPLPPYDSWSRPSVRALSRRPWQRPASTSRAAALRAGAAPTAAFEATRCVEPANGQVYDLAPSATGPHRPSCRRPSCRSSSRRRRDLATEARRSSRC